MVPRGYGSSDSLTPPSPLTLESWETGADKRRPLACAENCYLGFLSRVKVP